jgi:hypothetical protein
MWMSLTLVTQEPTIFKEEFVTLHHASYNQASKKLLIEKVYTTNKKIIQKMKINN